MPRENCSYKGEEINIKMTDLNNRGVNHGRMEEDYLCNVRYPLRP